MACIREETNTKFRVSLPELAFPNPQLSGVEESAPGRAVAGPGGTEHGAEPADPGFSVALPRRRGIGGEGGHREAGLWEAEWDQASVFNRTSIDALSARRAWCPHWAAQTLTQI